VSAVAAVPNPVEFGLVRLLRLAPLTRTAVGLRRPAGQVLLDEALGVLEEHGVVHLRVRHFDRGHIDHRIPVQVEAKRFQRRSVRAGVRAAHRAEIALGLFDQEPGERLRGGYKQTNKSERNTEKFEKKFKNKA